MYFELVMQRVDHAQIFLWILVLLYLLIIQSNNRVGWLGFDLLISNQSKLISITLLWLCVWYNVCVCSSQMILVACCPLQ